MTDETTSETAETEDIETTDEAAEIVDAVAADEIDDPAEETADDAPRVFIDPDSVAE